jgi:5,5'-dehydrodivanillate O-demethylase
VRSLRIRNAELAMLSDQDSDRLLLVGSHTAAGRLLRQYWHPVFPAEDLREPGSIRSFELLGEQLVAYRALDGEVAIVPAACPHRGASLAYGYVERAGLRCAYHGWLFSTDGVCLERPFESVAPSSRCHLPAYRAREQAGLIFVSLRPEGPPPFPLWDIVDHEDGGYRIDLQDDLACNWLQVQENAADVTHTIFLHSRAFASKGIVDESGFSAPLLEFGFQPFRYGMVKSWAYEGSDGERLEGWGNLLVFPTMMRIETEMHWRVPINDTRTRVIILVFEPDGDGVRTQLLPDRFDREGHYTMTDFYSQDAMAWETQGAIASRSSETLGASDVGIVMYRQMLASAIEDCEQGRDLQTQGDGEPINLRAWMNGYLPMSAPADPKPVERLPYDRVFDDSHRRYRIPSPVSPSPPVEEGSTEGSAAEHVEAVSPSPQSRKGQRPNTSKRSSLSRNRRSSWRPGSWWRQL